MDLVRKSKENSLRVAYFVGTFPQLTQTFVTREVFEIQSHGVQPYVFSLFKPSNKVSDPLAEELINRAFYGGFLSVDIIVAQFIFMIRRPIKYWRALWNVVRYTRGELRLRLKALLLFPKSVYFAREAERKNIDHIHAHFVTLAAISAQVVGQLLSKPVTLHGHAVDLFLRDRRALRRQMEEASGVVTISAYHRSYIRDLCPSLRDDGLIVVHCGVETTHFQRKRVSYRSAGPIRILAVGRLIEKKGFKYLIEACALLAASDRSFECTIVGEGPLRGELERLIVAKGLDRRVRLAGAMEQPELLALYQDCDIVVQPCVVAEDGNRDGVPVVLMEAMACELPVITSRVAGIGDLVEDGLTGVIIAEKDTEGLAKALEHLMDDPMLREELGVRGRQRVIDEFEIGQTTQRLADFFRAVVESNAARSRSDGESDETSVRKGGKPEALGSDRARLTS